MVYHVLTDILPSVEIIMIDFYKTEQEEGYKEEKTDKADKELEEMKEEINSNIQNSDRKSDQDQDMEHNAEELAVTFALTTQQEEKENEKEDKGELENITRSKKKITSIYKKKLTTTATVPTQEEPRRKWNI